MDELHAKLEQLKNILLEMKSVMIAFSSGVDSSFLLKIAHDILQDQALAVTVRSCLFPSRETQAAEDFCKAEGIRQILIETEPLTISGFCQNPPDRCYLCKQDLFRKILSEASLQGISWVAEGSNMDDLGDYRPGLKAIEELKIRSPLCEAGLGKSDIRQLSHELGLPTWNKASFACLASRFVYGEAITAEKLSMIDRAEQYLSDLGLHQFRVRIHGSLARIEVERSEFERIIRPEISRPLSAYLKELGFLYVSLDLDGYHTGNMNRSLTNASTQSQNIKDTLY